MVTMYKTRHLEAKIKNLSQHAKVILVVGARQVGKSTLLSHIFPDSPHITFDPFQDKYNVQADPDLFLQQFTKQKLSGGKVLANNLLPLLMFFSDILGQNRLFVAIKLTKPRRRVK